MPILEIFSQGEEVITGQVVDSNAAWLSQEGVELGFQIGRHTAVGDKLPDLVQALREIDRRADCCLCTGGLGPTTDDLTAEAVSEAFGLPLEFDGIAFEQIQRYFQNRKRPMAECNRKQAMLPRHATRIENTQGTAPGFAVQANRCLFIFMPGVPSEMKAMFSEQVRCILLGNFKLQPAKLITIRTIGIGESDLQERLMHTAIPQEVQLGFRAEIGEVQVKLLFPYDFQIAVRDEICANVAKTIGEPVYALEGLDGEQKQLVDVINALMLEKNYTLTLMESLSHGLVSAKMSGVSWLKMAMIRPVVATSPAMGDLPNENAYAKLKESAHSLMREYKSDMALIQLPAFETGQESANDSAITVHTGLLIKDDFFYKKNLLSGNFNRRQNQAATHMLDLLRRYLQNLKIQ